MRGILTRGGARAVLMLIGLVPPGMAAAAAETNDRLNVELNKFEAFAGGCRTFFLIRNPSEQAFTAFDMSLAILDRDGRIDRLLTVDAAPIPAGRTSLKLFEIADADCTAIGQVLLYEIGSCATAKETPGDCFALVDLRSRAGAPLVK